MDIVSPEKIKKINKNNYPKNEWMTTGLLTSLRKKNILYKKCKSTIQDSPERKKYIKYRNLYNKLLKQAKISYYDLQFNNYRNDSKKTWEIINKLINKKEMVILQFKS